MNRLALELIADANPLLKTLDAAQRNIDRFTRASDAAGHSLGSGVNRALDAFEGLAKGGATAAGVFAGGVMAAASAALLMTTNAGKQVEAIDHLSQKTGIAVQSLQDWSVIMAENGFQAETLTGGMRTMSKQMTDALDPASQAATTFDALGISLTALGSTESTIRAVADKFKDIPNGAEKARLAVTLFGKAGLEMIPMLNRGAAAFDESRAASERFGAVLSGQQVSALNAVDDASDRLGIALDGLKLQLASTFAGSVQTGIEAVTNGIARLTNITTNYSTALEQIKKDHPVVFSMMPGMAAAMAAAKASNMPPPVPPSLPGGPQDSHAIEFALAQGQKQEALGQRLLIQHLKVEKTLEGQRHAQEALGKTTLAIIQRETAERNTAFALQLEQADELNNQHFAPTGSTASKVLDAQIAAVTNLMQLYPELNAQEAALLAIHNQDHAASTIQEASLAYQHRNDALDEALVKTKALDDQQSALFRSEAGLFGASDAARRVRFSLIDAEAERKRQAIEEEIFDETRKAEAIQNLTIETETKRREAIQSFPSFFEQQMQSLVNSNTFSMGQMVSTWSGGIAQMVVHGGNLKAAWEQTQVALVQAALNSGVQMLAQAALSASLEIGLRTATEGSKTAALAAGSVARIAIAEEEALTTESVYTGMAKSVFGALAAVQSATVSFMMGAWAVLMKIGTFVVGLLSTIAAALEATIFGIPVGLVIGAAAIGLAAYLASQGEVMAAVGVGLAGVAAGAAGLGLIGGGAGGEVFPEVSTVGFAADGLIATGPTPRIFGEAGPEAAIPLNSRGAAFMANMLGMGGGDGEHTTNIYLDGELIARNTERRIRQRVSLEGVFA